MAAQETGFLWSAEILKSRARSVDYIRKNFMSGTVKSTNWKISFMTVYVK